MRRSYRWSLLCLLAASLQLLAAPSAPQIEAIRIALQSNDVEAAADAADAAVAALPTNAEAWHVAAGAYVQMAQQASIFSKLSWAKQCVAAYQKAIELDPRRFSAQMDLMQFYLKAPGIAGGGRDKAEARVVDIAKLDAGWGHIAKAVIALTDKDDVGHEREILAAIAADPQEMRHRVFYAVFLASKQRWDEGFKLIDAGLAKVPDDLRLGYQVGRLAALSGQQLERGLLALEKVQATTEIPDDISKGGAMWRSGQILEKLGRSAEALPAYRRAAVLEPELKALIEKDIARLQKG